MIPSDLEGTTAMEGNPPSDPVGEEAAGDISAGEKPWLSILPEFGWAPLNLRELWQFRDLLFTLAARDLKLRYKQTLLGVIWVILQPLLAAGVFSFVFGIVAKLPSGKVPYLVFSYAGLLGWNLFSGVLTRITGSLVANSHLIAKVFFPRLILPLSSIGSVLVDFSVAAVMMAVLMMIFHVAPSPMLALLPLWMLVLTAIALGTGLVAAALAVSYRDVQYIMPVFTQILLYASPVAYSVAAVPARYRWVYLLNPLTPPLEAMRASLLGTALPGWQSLGISFALGAVLLLAGLYSFKRMERKFADVI
jgi:lipopolysaccharide transport system permease protein